MKEQDTKIIFIDSTVTTSKEAIELAKQLN
jgi:hypothetical protein